MGSALTLQALCLWPGASPDMHDTRLHTAKARPTRSCRVPDTSLRSRLRCAPRSRALLQTRMVPQMCCQCCLRIKMRVDLHKAKRQHFSPDTLHPASSKTSRAADVALKVVDQARGPLAEREKS
eukprot:1694057-Alexandrium_andersonii.AAC.1